MRISYLDCIHHSSDPSSRYCYTPTLIISFRVEMWQPNCIYVCVVYRPFWSRREGSISIMTYSDAICPNQSYLVISLRATAATTMVGLPHYTRCVTGVNGGKGTRSIKKDGRIWALATSTRCYCATWASFSRLLLISICGWVAAYRVEGQEEEEEEVDDDCCCCCCCCRSNELQLTDNAQRISVQGIAGDLTCLSLFVFLFPLLYSVRQLLSS